MFGKKPNETADRPDAALSEFAPTLEDGQPWGASTPVSPASAPSVKEGDQQPSVISQSVRFEGSLVSSGPLHLHCELTGQVTAPFVLIGATGKAKGTLNVDEISVEGSLDGDVICKLLKVGRNALVHGDINCENLQVSLGATVSGNLVVGRPLKL